MAEKDRGRLISKQILNELYPGAITELIRFLESGKLAQITEEQRFAVGNYQSIEIGGETYFGNMTNGKGVSSVIYLAQQYGADVLITELKKIENFLAD